MKYVFLVNSFSLGNKTEEIIRRINLTCKELNYDNYVIEINSENESTEDVLKRYSTSSNVIFAIGGDGTINRVLNGIVNTRNILGFIPYGTGNDFYHYVNDNNLEGYNSVDLIRINDKFFINVACFGIDADIANQSEIIHSKIIPKSQRYNIGVLYNFLKYKAKHMKVYIGSEVIENDFTTVVVCNAKYYGGGYKIGPSSNISDGKIEVYTVKRLPKLKMGKLILSTKTGSHEKDTINIRKDITKRLLITSDSEISCNIDGEELTSNSFDIEVIPKGIEIYVDQKLIEGISRSRKK